MNMQRMNLSAQRLGLPTFDGLELMRCMSRLISIDQEWVPHTESASLYIRPTIIGIEPTLGVASSDSAMLYTILSPAGAYFDSKTKAVSLMADPQYVRAWPGGAGNRKLGSNYAPTIAIQKAAAERGLQQVLWLYGEDHLVTEVGVMNFFMLYINEQGGELYRGIKVRGNSQFNGFFIVTEKELITPPLNGLILPGVTRDSILLMAQALGMCKVREGDIPMAWVRELVKQERVLEMFGAGTACIVCPVERIQYQGDDLHIPTMEQEKPLFSQMKDALTDIQYGKVNHPWALVIE